MLTIIGLLDVLQIRSTLLRYAAVPNVAASRGRRGLVLGRFGKALTAVVAAEMRLLVGETINKADAAIIAQRGRLLLGLLFGDDSGGIVALQKRDMKDAQIIALDRWQCGKEGADVRRQFTDELQACLFFLDECIAEEKKYSALGYSLTLAEHYARFGRNQAKPRDTVDFSRFSVDVESAQPRRLTDAADSARYLAPRRDTDGLDVAAFFGGE